MQKEKIRNIVQEVVRNAMLSTKQKKVPIAISNRHVHLSPEHVERLFGKGYQLRHLKDLSQPNQFAAKDTVTLIGPKGSIQHVRVLGPPRGKTQVEISIFDGFTLGVRPPIRHSGDIQGSESIIIRGPRGQLKIDEGLICAARHIHMHTSDAEHFNVSDGDRVLVKVDGIRGLTFTNVLIRVSSKYKLEMHVDLDEANAANINNGQLGEIMASEDQVTGGRACGS